jgi:hypothetical protein
LFDDKEKPHNASAEEKGRTKRNFHKVMDVMMAGLVKGQIGVDDCLKQVPLKLGDRSFVVEGMCPLSFVINDSKQGDQLCFQVNGHHSSILRHHRSCDSLYEDLDSPEVLCKFLLPDKTKVLPHLSAALSVESISQVILVSAPGLLWQQKLWETNTCMHVACL